MSLCPRCGARIGASCPICDWRTSEDEGEEAVSPSRRRLVVWTAAGSLAAFGALFVGAIAAYIRG